MDTTIIREKRLISLNSANATQYLNGSYNSNLVFDFSSILTPEKNIMYVEAGVQSAQIPASFYNIDTANNVFNYQISGIVYNIILTPGSYNYTTLITEMTTRFAVNGHVFTFALNRATNRLTMTYPVGGWQFIYPSSLFNIGLVPTTTYTVTANTFTFPRLFNLINPKKLKIFSNNLAIDSFDSVGNSTTNLIETLSVNAAPFGLILYNNLDNTYGHMRNSYLSTVDIQIRDEFGNFVNLNSIDWTMTIVLIVYKRLDTTTAVLEQPGNTIDMPT
jgi:hypothetical protein